MEPPECITSPCSVTSRTLIPRGAHEWRCRCPDPQRTTVRPSRDCPPRRWYFGVIFDQLRRPRPCSRACLQHLPLLRRPACARAPSSMRQKRGPAQAGSRADIRSCAWRPLHARTTMFCSAPPSTMSMARSSSRGTRIKSATTPCTPLHLAPPRLEQHLLDRVVDSPRSRAASARSSFRRGSALWRLFWRSVTVRGIAACPAADFPLAAHPARANC